MSVAGESLAGIKILAIDSLTEICALCIKQIVEVDRRALISERTQGKKDRPQGTYEDLMVLEDWNLFGNRMRGMLGLFAHLPCHTIMTSLVDWREDKRTGTVHRVPNINGKLALEVPAWFDLVMHMESQPGDEGQPVRVWRTWNDGTIMAKDSTGKLEPFEIPNWTAVFKKIFAPVAMPVATAAA